MINPMENVKERIILVESDPQLAELITQQALQPMGYRVDAYESADIALKAIARSLPDLIITDLELPGISTKDLLVALTSQGINLPIIIVTPKGRESDALQAFRLGATNFLTHPLREAEIINVVEDTLRQSRARTELEQVSQQLDQASKKLKKYTDDLVDIFAIARLTPSSANQQAIYDKIINTAIRVSMADGAWIAVFDIHKGKYILRACSNVAEDLQNKLNQPCEDSISSLVAISGTQISLHGEALKDINLSNSMQALLAVPIRWKDETVGILAVLRKSLDPFSTDQQALLDMLAEFTSLLIENARRYQILEQRLYQLQQASVYSIIDADLKNDLLRQASLEIWDPLKSLMHNLDILTNLTDRRMSLKQSDALNIIQEEADNLMDIVDAMTRIEPGDLSTTLEEIDLVQVVHSAINRYIAIAQVCRVAIKVELPGDPAVVTVFPSQISRVIEGLISNALKYCPAKSEITIRVEPKEAEYLFSIHNQGEGIDENLLSNLFDKKSGLYGDQAKRFGGIGISLSMIKEIITAHQGQVWVESGPGKGFTVFFSLKR
jgi:signal transduction histidine kinase/AmiR/NasT family two-component response regulator